MTQPQSPNGDAKAIEQVTWWPDEDTHCQLRVLCVTGPAVGEDCQRHATHADLAAAIKAMPSPQRTLLLIDVVEDSSALGQVRAELEAVRLELETTRAERDRARAELGEIVVAAAVRPGEEWTGRPSASCDAVASILAERDMLDSKLTTERTRVEEAEESVAVLEPQVARLTREHMRLGAELAATNARIAEYKASEADWREQLRAANARVADAERCAMVCLWDGSYIRCDKRAGHEMGHDYSGAPGPEPALSSAPQASTEQCPTADPIVGNDPSFDNQPVVAQASAEHVHDPLTMGPRYTCGPCKTAHTALVQASANPNATARFVRPPAVTFEPDYVTRAELVTALREAADGAGADVSNFVFEVCARLGGK